MKDVRSLGGDEAQLRDKCMEEWGDFDVEFAQKLLPIMRPICIAIVISRFLLFIISLKYPGICKFYVYFEVVARALNFSLPSNRGTTWPGTIYLLNFL